MIVGTVRRNGDPVVSLVVRGPAGRAQIEAVVDTGFSDCLALPKNVIAALGLPVLDEGQMMLADGTLVETTAYFDEVEWLNTEREATVTEISGTALVGMSLMLECRLTIDVVPGGRVQIDKLA